MRYRDLTEAAPKTRSDAEQRLVSAGYQRLGKGHFGSVWQKPGAAQVVKLFAADDRAYLAFLDMVRANPNPHFPRILGKTLYVNAETFAVRLEPLTELPWFSDRAVFFLETAMLYMQTKNYKPADPQSHYWLGVLDARDWMDEHPDVQKACDLMVDLLGVNRLDLKTDNLMLRGKTYVFTDPLVEKAD
jgi:hypothetical protein